MSNPTSYVICHACKQAVVMTELVSINYILEDGRVVPGHECKSCAHGDPEEDELPEDFFDCKERGCTKKVANPGVYFCAEHLEVK